MLAIAESTLTVIANFVSAKPLAANGRTISRTRVSMLDLLFMINRESVIAFSLL